MEEDARLAALFLWTIQSTNIEAMNGEEEVVDEGVSDEENAEDEASRGKQKGFSLIFDVVRRFAQPLGIHLPDWEGRIIETKKGVIRLLPVAERARQLFGEDGAEAVANQLEQHSGGVVQLALFTEGAAGERRVFGGRGRRKKRCTDVTDEALNVQREVTTLDRIHAAMLLQSSGRANALRALLKAEQDRGPEFLRLANALSALYPKELCTKSRFCGSFVVGFMLHSYHV
jgi:putative DNA methylase